MQPVPPYAPARLTAIRVWLLLGTLAISSVEVLSALGGLTRGWVALVWGVALVLAAAVAWVSGVRLPRPSPRRWWREATGLERTAGIVLCGLLLAELVVAVLAEPNNYDSQTYHLPRIEHWVADRSVAFFPTAIHRQVTLPPGAEYLLLHLRLLSGGDLLYNLVQYAAGLVALAAATRITGQLGGARRAQLITALLVGTTPMVVLQASSTQTDLIVASWVACLATLVLDGVWRRATPGDVLVLGAATGVLATSKTTGLLAAGPLLLIWGVAQLHQHRLLRTVVAGAGVLVVAALLAGPYLVRMTVEFGSPLGPPELSTSIPTQRHDPAATVVNGLRIGLTALDTPFTGVREAGSALADGVAHAVGVPVNDPAITFAGTAFPIPAWYPDEDRVSFPIAGTVALLAVVLALVAPARVSPGPALMTRAYALVPVIGFVLYAASVKWQPWGNRLLLFLLVLATPLAGVWLGGVRWRRPGRRVVGALVALSCVAGILAVGYGFPRRLVGSGSVLTTAPNQTRFLRRPRWLPDYRWGADRIAASGARRVGLIEANDDWEYPWWVLLPGRDFVALRSTLKAHPPAAPSSVDAIVCTAADRVCRSLVPRGWTYARHGIVVVALPPD